MEIRTMKHAMQLAKHFCRLWESTWTVPENRSLDHADTYQLLKQIVAEGYSPKVREQLLGAINSLHSYALETEANFDECEISEDWSLFILAVSCFCKTQGFFDSILKDFESEFKHASLMHRQTMSEQGNRASFYYGRMTGLTIALGSLQGIAKDSGIDDRIPQG
jgi:hypothetical protein